MYINTFTGDSPAQKHARAWAVFQYGEDNADLFVAWLLTLSDDEQTRVYNTGYPAIRDEFEAAYPDLRS